MVLLLLFAPYSEIMEFFSIFFSFFVFCFLFILFAPFHFRLCECVAVAVIFFVAFPQHPDKYASRCTKRTHKHFRGMSEKRNLLSIGFDTMEPEWFTHSRTSIYLLTINNNNIIWWTNLPNLQRAICVSLSFCLSNELRSRSIQFSQETGYLDSRRSILSPLLGQCRHKCACAIFHALIGSYVRRHVLFLLSAKLSRWPLYGPDMGWRVLIKQFEFKSMNVHAHKMDFIGTWSVNWFFSWPPTRWGLHLRLTQTP